MVKRRNNQLADNLPQLQNLIKRSPESYNDEFMQQLRHYQSLMELFKHNPGDYNKRLDDLVMFIAQIAHCYGETLVQFPQEIIDLLKTHAPVLDPQMRMTFCKTLVHLRNKNLLAPLDLLDIFFLLAEVPDRQLRSYLEEFIITDIKNVNKDKKNAKINAMLQDFLARKMEENHPKASKMAMSIMKQLYRKRVWQDLRTVNVMRNICVSSKDIKLRINAINFFLDAEEPDPEEENSDSDDDKITAKDVLMSNKFNKKTRKREAKLKKAKQLVKKHAKKKGEKQVFHTSPLLLAYDHADMVTELFKLLDGKTHIKYEIKLLIMDIISRLINISELAIPNFYPYMQRLLQPHQRDVTKLLLFIARASHSQVHPAMLSPILRTIADNFITERNQSDAIAIGINAVREICQGCPLALTEDLLQDLIKYEDHRERSVKMAARSLKIFYRKAGPHLLKRKQKGAFVDLELEHKSRHFGESNAVSYVPGAEALIEEDSDDSGLIELSDSEEDIVKNITLPSETDGADVSGPSGLNDSNLEYQEDEGEVEEEECEDEEDNEGEEEEEEEGSDDDSDDPEKVLEAVNEKDPVKVAQKAEDVCLTRFLTDDDFKKIEAFQVAKQMSRVKSLKRPLEEEEERDGPVRIEDIENIYKKRKNSKQDRIESIRKGQEGREKFGYKDGRQNPFASTTNREKKKNKNFMMVRHKARSKVKRSFKDKQIALRNYLTKQKKMR